MAHTGNKRDSFGPDVSDSSAIRYGLDCRDSVHGMASTGNKRDSFGPDASDSSAIRYGLEGRDSVHGMKTGTRLGHRIQSGSVTHVSSSASPGEAHHQFTPRTGIYFFRVYVDE
jgi:hypothetical protein